MRTILVWLLVMLGLPGTSHASTAPASASANPELVAREQGIDDPERQSEALRLASVLLDIDVVGALAEITLTARFQNPGDDTLEGDFSFELPAGAVVTGYALDIEDRMLDGVLVDPLKAERAYEAQVREGIDPGVARVSRANTFSTRVFPIPQQGTRTIRLKFAAPIHPELGLAFPLRTAAPVGEFTVQVRTFALSGAPVLTLPNRMPFEWRQTPHGVAADVRLGGARLTGQLRIDPVRPRQPALASRHGNGERRVHIVDSAAQGSRQAATGRRLRVYWDHSLSRRDQQLTEERALLANYIAQAKPASIDLVLFNSSGARLRHLSGEELSAALREVVYRGATSFAVLGELDAPAADLCLMFSDGVATLDARADFDPGCEVFAITSAADADRGFLQRLAGGRADAVLQMRARTHKEILARLAGGGPRVVQARGTDGRALNFAALDGGAMGWSVITERPVSGDVILRIAGLGSAPVERRYAPVAARTARFDGAAALWAADRVALLAAEDGAHEEFVELSRRYSVASPGLSFLVLEAALDYVEADIAPPPNYPAERLAEYREIKAAYDDAWREAQSGRLDRVVESWQEVVDWWNTDFDPRARKGAAEKNGPAGAPFRSRRGGGGGSGAEELEEVTVTGLRASMNTSMDVSRMAAGVSMSDIEIWMEEWNVVRPYIQALDAAAPGEVDRVLAEQERQFGLMPAFYFDVAEWLHLRQRHAEAIEMLLSALELAMANEETASMVADRLQRYGEQDRAVWLLERAAQRTDYLPQPKRSLALALARRAESAPGANGRADLRRAVELLNEVIMTPWPEAHDGIEIVALMEANRLLPRLGVLGAGRAPLHPRLRALLDVDLRVIIEWNTAATDMDLWVDEPNGERAIYSNPRTAMGGRLSNDMTEGFGPEEYLLRRAAKGEYRISVDVYAADAISPNGSTVVTARMFRNYGRPEQREQTMEIELEPDDSGEKLIGTFTVQ
jgi:vault protein inter-alpha-trypsin-like protein